METGKDTAPEAFKHYRLIKHLDVSGNPGVAQRNDKLDGGWAWPKTGDVIALSELAAEALNREGYIDITQPVDDAVSAPRKRGKAKE